jgi:hypothetical protein
MTLPIIGICQPEVSEYLAFNLCVEDPAITISCHSACDSHPFHVCDGYCLLVANRGVPCLTIDLLVICSVFITINFSFSVFLFLSQCMGLIVSSVRLLAVCMK